MPDGRRRRRATNVPLLAPSGQMLPNAVDKVAGAAARVEPLPLTGAWPASRRSWPWGHRRRWRSS